MILRINELAKELGKSNRDILNYLSEKGIDNKVPMSNISAQEEGMIRTHFAPKKPEPPKQEAPKADAAGTAAEAPKKKKFTAVFRPQNAQQLRLKPKTAPKPAAAPAAQQPKEAAPAPKPAEAAPAAQQPKEAAPAPKPAETAPAAQQPKEAAPAPKPAEAAPAAQQPKEAAPAAQQPQAPAARPAAPAARPAAQQPQAPANRPAGSVYQGNRPQGDRYQGNRPAGTGYQGNRPAGTGYQGNRPAGTGYQGNRPQGDRFQGNRPAGTGFQGGSGRPGSGFGGGRPGSGFGGKTQPQGDGALVKKSVSNRPNKNNFKDKNDKRHRTEDGFKTGKGGRGGSIHAFEQQGVKPKAVKVEEEIKELIIPDTITINDLAKKMKKNASELIKKMFIKGEIYNINSEIPYEKAEEIALDYDILCTREEKVDVIEELLREDAEDESAMVPRPPVVCVMGHVDHGKTSLLDAIRNTSVTSREAGGITQHIGAYQVKINDRLITFLDTPGHEAFTAMRMRGAQATDIAVLIVAADDGVMPQTIEAINHAKAAGVEIIVAINKIDKPNANVDRVKQELTEYQLISEDWGGSTIMCPISAKTGEGIENLLEMILLTADMKELKADPNRNARGLVIEAQLDKGRGPVATILVQKGTLHVGDFVAAGACSGKVRAMLNENGARMKEAKPSTPVAILGLNNVPNAGEIFVAMDSDKEAKDFAATFISEGKSKLIEETKAKQISIDNLFDQIKSGNVQELPIIVKADVQGSVEAVRTSLLKLSNDEVQVKVIHGAVGAISESDVALASASNAIIIGFNVRPDAMAKSTAEHEGVDIRLYKVIYQAIEDIESAMKGMLAPVYEEKVIGHAEVRMLFKSSGVGTIAGSYILDGKIQRGCKARITRDGKQIFDGNLASLKRFKDDVKEVNAGYECGLVFEKFSDLMEGDLVEAYAMVEVPRN
jgi:translation initiation factor IF-2